MKRNIDTTRPHIGRIYDYVLGGTQNFEADRKVAEAVVSQAPILRTWAQLNRWFLQFVASRWAEQGIRRVLDLGSGLPTQGHFNEHIPDGRILFSDYDALSAEYGEELLKDKPNMRYVQADVREPEPLLEIARQFFGTDRTLGIGCIGLIYFLTDEELRRLFKALHAFSLPGTVLAVSYFNPAPPGSALEGAVKEYMRTVKTTVAFRTPEHTAELLQPWRIVEQKPLEDWLDIRHLMPEEQVQQGKSGTKGLLAVHS